MRDLGQSRCRDVCGWDSRNPADEVASRRVGVFAKKPIIGVGIVSRDVPFASRPNGTLVPEAQSSDGRRGSAGAITQAGIGIELAR